MNIRFYIIVLFLLSAASVSLAGAPPPPTGGPGCWPPPCVPIDGGISLLVAAGILYGGKKLHTRKKQKSKL